jgi:Tfp pilus assembly protein PilE
MKSSLLIKRQYGFGLLESLVGLLVFVLLIFVGAKAYHNVVSNHKKAAQLKTLTDAVAVTAEKMVNITVSTLIDPSKGYTTWSLPQDAGLGDYVYQYRIVPKPNIGGAVDSNVVGLEVQTGTLQKGVFKMERSFATLIAPRLSSKNDQGNSSTLAERQGEAAFYASLRQKLADVAKQVIPENQNLLNSYNCYNPNECCGFMQDYFKDPTLNPNDGLKEKCLYRCALSGNVGINSWKDACKSDFCAAAPWKTSADCCKAIAAGQCPNGGVCASVCYDCVHEDGSNCGTTTTTIATCAGDDEFNEFFDCQNLTYCDGTPLAYGNVPGWGDVRSACQTPACKNLKSDCGVQTVDQCCDSYWETLARGDVPEERFNVCARISNKSDCCDINISRYDWNFICTNSGTVAASIYNGKTYCGSSPFSRSMDHFCSLYKGCSEPYGGYSKSAPSGCINWTGSLRDGVSDGKTYTSSTSSTSSSSTSSTSSTSSGQSQPVLKAPGSVKRVPANRKGTPISGAGGNE